MNKVTKDTNYLSWDNYFMGVALLSSMRSKDPNTKVGACIVNQSKRIIGIGYNGLPVGCSDDEYPWGREGDFLGYQVSLCRACRTECDFECNNFAGRRNSLRDAFSLSRMCKIDYSKRNKGNRLYER